MYHRYKTIYIRTAGTYFRCKTIQSNRYVLQIVNYVEPQVQTSDTELY